MGMAMGMVTVTVTSDGCPSRRSLRSPLQLGTGMKYDYDHEHPPSPSRLCDELRRAKGFGWQATTRSRIINH
jgi:hypothetical protein